MEKFQRKFIPFAILSNSNIGSLKNICQIPNIQKCIYPYTYESHENNECGVNEKSKKYYVNELNTIPGSLAFYLWTPLNKEYDELLDDMINIAVKRYKKKLKKTTIFESNILQGFNGTKGTKGFKGKLK